MTDPRNVDNWAKPIDVFHVHETIQGVHKGNIEGRRPTGPLHGFGQLWQKSYEVSIPGPSPEEVVQTWKDDFADLWYPGNEFYAASRRHCSR